MQQGPHKPHRSSECGPTRCASRSCAQARAKRGVPSPTACGNTSAPSKCQPQTMRCDLRLHCNLEPFEGVLRCRVDVRDIVSGIASGLARRVSSLPKTPLKAALRQARRQLSVRLRHLEILRTGAIQPLGALQRHGASVVPALESALRSVYVRCIEPSRSRLWDVHDGL